VDQDLQKYYEERFSMMGTIGWKDFIEDVQTLFDSYDKVNSIGSPDDFYFRKGQLDILQWILNLKAVSEQTYEELQNEKDL
jgi:hypothetical protein